MAKVLIMGSDLQGELALLQQLQAMAHAPGLVLDLCHDFRDCDLLVVRDNPVLRNAARRIAANHPDLPMWSLADDGQLADALHEPPVPMDQAQVRQRLRRMQPGVEAAFPELEEIAPAAVAPTSPAPPQPAAPSPAPVPAPATPAPVASVIPLAGPLAPADPGPLGEAIRNRLLAANMVTALCLDGEQRLLLDFRRLLAIVAPGSDLGGQPPEQFLGRGFGRFTLHALPAARYSALFVDLPSVALIPLLWQATLRMQVEPVLLDPLHEGCRLRLTRWPDFRVLAHRHDDFRLCSLLLRRACTPAEAGLALTIDAGAARAFFNAAWLTGYAQVESTGKQASAPGTPARARGAGSLLASMWRSVRGGTKGD